MAIPSRDINTFRDLEVFQAAFVQQQKIFTLSKRWPRDEAYSLTDQARRSSRSIGASLAEAWGKRRYPAHFLSKLTDADAELQETSHWITTAYKCGYLSSDELSDIVESIGQIGRQLGRMIEKHELFCLRG